MREIKTTETIEKVVGYEAIDGKRFDSKDECEKYDKTAAAVIKADFKKLIVKVMELCQITSYADVPFSDIGEDCYVALVRIKDHNDLKTCNMYSELTRQKCYFTDDMVGKDIIVYIGWGDGKGNCDYANGYPVGTIDDCLEAYKNGLMKLFKPDEKEKEN